MIFILYLVMFNFIQIKENYLKVDFEYRITIITHFTPHCIRMNIVECGFDMVYILSTNNTTSTFLNNHIVRTKIFLSAFAFA